VFFKQRRGKLEQLVRVSITVPRAGSYELIVSGKDWRRACPLRDVPEGRSVQELLLPDVREKARVSCTLRKGGKDVSAPRNVVWKPGRHWQVHLANHAHFDPGYTDLASNVMRNYLGDLDNIVRFCRDTADYPEDAKYRYVIEQSWVLLHYLKHRGRREQKAIIKLLREGRLEVNAFLANMVTELMGAEQMARLVYGAFGLRRRYGIPVTSAANVDIPGLSWSTMTLLAKCGVRYFAATFPTYFRWGSTRYHAFWDETRIQPNDIPTVYRWEGPTGDTALCYSGGQGASGSVDLSLRSVEQYLEWCEKHGYPYDCLQYMIMGGWSDNALARPEYSDSVRRHNSRWAFPRYILSTNKMFFEQLEAEAGDTPPTYRGELPGTDYPIGALSTAKETAMARTCHDFTPSAEKFATVASAVSDCPCQRRYLDEAYDYLNYADEHVWGVASPVGPAQEAALIEQKTYAHLATALTHDVHTKVQNKIVDSIARKRDGQYVVVFNPLSWSRTDVVREPISPFRPCSTPMKPVDTPDGIRHTSGYGLGRDPQDFDHGFVEKPFRIVDVTTGRTAPHQLVELSSARAPTRHAPQRYSRGFGEPAHRWDVQFLAPDVPAMGYKLFKVERAKSRPRPSSALRVTRTSLENRFFKVKVDPDTGAVVSVLDKETGRELVDQRSGRTLNEVIGRSIVTGRVEKQGKARVEVGMRGPVSASIVVHGDAPGCPRRTQEIVLYRDLKRIDLATRLLKDGDASRELFVAFPFDVRKPRFRYETPFAVVRYLEDQMPGSNSDYATAQHWADVSNGEHGITWCAVDAPQVMFGKLWPGYLSPAHRGVMVPGFVHAFETDPAKIKKGHLYSFIITNNFCTNFHPSQVDDVLFRYSFRPHAGDWRRGDAQRFGWGVCHPLNAVFVSGAGAGTLPASDGFIQVDSPDVNVLTVKRSERGDGIVVRLADLSGEGARARVSLPWWRIERAYVTSIAEERLSAISHTRHAFEIELGTWDVVTVELCGRGKQGRITQVSGGRRA